MANQAMIAGLRRRVVEALRRVLARHESCVLVDYPRHLNVGDQAIWLGERYALRSLGVVVRMACERSDYNAPRLRRHLEGGAVVLHGGGNFGDLYPTHHALRERVLADFRDVPLVQLPQSISFSDASVLDRTRRLVAAHGDATVVVRDGVSETFAREQFDAQIVLAPDSAFALGPLPRPAQGPKEPIVYLARTDRESSHRRPEGHATVDWLGPPSTFNDRLALWTKEARLTAATGRRPSGRRAFRIGGGAVLRSFDDYAAWSVRRGTRMLSQGRVVVTDRLHGHILCTLMSIPHVLLDSSDGKVRNFWDTWTNGSPIARWADDPDQALELADELARGAD
jgi:exopolysaccharide biosynthesis predicted pyruvyltransferase EpsI